MEFMKKYFANTRKPEGFLGKMMITGMNFGHGAVSDWGLSMFPKESLHRIVELGCGGGKTAGKLLKKYPEAHVTALDYSEVSVAKASRENARAVAEGRCQVIQGDVSDLPFPEDSFELAAAFETVYFWPGPVESFRQVHRVLKTGGRFIIVNESDGENPADQKWVDMIDGMHTYDKHQLKDALLEAGFSSVESHQDPRKHRLCVIAVK